MTAPDHTSILFKSHLARTGVSIHDPPLIMDFGSVFGQDMACLLLCSGRCGGAGLEAEAVVSGLQDVAAMRETIEQCSCLNRPEFVGDHKLK